MKDKLRTVYRALDVLLDKRLANRILTARAYRGRMPGEKTEKLKRLLAEVSVECGKKVEKKIGRSLERSEFYLLVNRVGNFIKENLKAPVIR